MNDDAMSKALDAIYEETQKLLNRDDLPEEVKKHLDYIQSIARYKFDNRGDNEKGLK